MAQHVHQRSPPNVLDHESEQGVVGIRVQELLIRGSTMGADERQHLGRRPVTAAMRRHPLLHVLAVPIRDAGEHLEQLADRCSVGVEVEVRREVVGGRGVQREFAALDQLHHLSGDHRLRDARDAELTVDPNVSNAVRRTRRPAPRAVGGHHGGRHPGSVEGGHVVQDRLELGGLLLGDRVLADVGEPLGRECWRFLGWGG